MSIYEQALQGFIGAVIIVFIVRLYRKNKATKKLQTIDPSSPSKVELKNDNDPEGLNIVRGAIQIVIFGFVALSIIALMI